MFFIYSVGFWGGLIKLMYLKYFKEYLEYGILEILNI